MKTEELQGLLSEVDRWLARVVANMPHKISASALGVRSTAPYKALAIRGALLWRTEELARGASASIKQGDVATAILLIRGVVENTALMARLAQVVFERGRSSTPVLDEALTRMLLGWKTQTAGIPAAYNILTMIDHLDRRHQGVRRAYDHMSEFAHPNWGGVRSLFSRTDNEQFETLFGRFESKQRVPRQHAVVALAACIGLFEFDYNNLGDIMPDWIAELEKF